MAMTLRPDPELAEALDEMATHEHVPQTEIIRRAVLERLARKRHELLVDAAHQRQSARWRGFLDRLSES